MCICICMYMYICAHHVVEPQVEFVEGKHFIALMRGLPGIVLVSEPIYISEMYPPPPHIGAQGERANRPGQRPSSLAHT